MGTLYLARDTNPTTDRLVALKLLNANLEHGDLRARFEREARSLAALSHPNIVVIHDSGEYGGAPFIVMEYVRGESLAEKIRRRCPMSLGQKVRLMAELCDGLAHAHSAGIIHRDIKPANLMVDQHGRLKILDFGIAREGDGRHTHVGAPLTRLHMAIGTPGYMSPEQIEGVDIDHRSDLFSAGTVCYELLTYREAFAGATTRQIEKRVMHDEPPALDGLVPGLDPRLAEVITRAMKKEPADRAQTAGELHDAFMRIRAALPPDEQPTHVTPMPVLEASGGRDSRRRRAAEAAYQRAAAARAEGALEFARRSALEALAEDAEHAAARALLRDLGGEADAAPLVDATELATGNPAPQTLSGAATVVTPPGGRRRRQPTPPPFGSDQRSWMRWAPLAAAVLVAGLALAGALIYRDAWFGGEDGAARTSPPPVAPADTGSTPVAGGDGAPIIPTTLLASLRDAGGVAITDAELFLSPGDQAAFGDGSGQYVFESVAPGAYTLTARHRAFRERTVPVDVQPGGTRQELVLDRLRDPGPLTGPGDNRRFGGTGGRPEPAPPPRDGRVTELPPPLPPPQSQSQSQSQPQPPAQPPAPEAPKVTPQSAVLAHDAMEQAVRALNQDGDVDRAERLLTEAQRLDPTSKEIAREMERLREIRAAERRQRVREFVLRAQRLYREAGDLDGAMRAVDAALQLLPSDPQAVGLREEILRVKAIGVKKQ